MIPQIIQFGAFPVNSFGLLVALALFAGILSLQRSLARYGVNPEHAEGLVFVAGISGIIGARLLHLIEIFDGFTAEFQAALFAPAGFTFYGGFILASVCVALFSILKKLPISCIAGAAAPAVALGYAIGRLGCQLSGDGDYGMYTHSILGMSYSTGYVPTPPGILAYPTPLYESAMCIVIAFLLYSMEKRPYWIERPLAIFGVGVFLLAVERFAIEFLRLNPILFGSFTQAQLIALGVGLVALFFIKTAPVHKHQNPLQQV